MAPVVTLRQLLEAGVHFGHQTRRWNPKMKRFIHGERSGIYIIDLEKTLEHIAVSYAFVRDMVADGGNLLFVGTKKQAKDSVQSYAEKCGMPYINERWLGGMLTNFDTISKRVGKMKDYQRMRVSGEFEAMPKKEALLLGRELIKLERNLGGIRNMEALPDAVFILDTKKEHIAVTEANKLGLPVIAVVDTNCDPDIVQYVIPGNDDAIRSGELMCRIMADAVAEGRYIRQARTGETEATPRSIEEEAEYARQQSEARSQAATQAVARDARIAAQADETDSPDPETAEASVADAVDEGSDASADDAAVEAPAEDAVDGAGDAAVEDAAVEAPAGDAVDGAGDAAAEDAVDATAEASVEEAEAATDAEPAAEAEATEES